jgi:hypothetical protein
MTWQWHRAMANVVSVAPSPAWLDNAIASMTRQHHHQHDSAATMRHSQCLLGSIANASMTQGFDAYFLDQQSGLEVHRWSGSRAQQIPLRPTTQIGYMTTDTSLILNVTSKIMGYFI